MVLLQDVEKGDLIRFSKRGDVWAVLSTGHHITCVNKYTNKESRFKPYTRRNGTFYNRKVEIVDFY